MDCSRTEDRTQNHLGANVHQCERDIITIRPCDFNVVCSKNSYLIIYDCLQKCRCLADLIGPALCKDGEIEIVGDQIKQVLG
jgi:hypothetical protein